MNKQNLFSEPDPPKTCGNCGTCGACEKRRTQAGHYCALSLLTVDEASPACGNGWWYPRVDHVTFPE
jgi:hypothetical protein